MKFASLLLVCLLLTGCLTTTKAVFDDSNSIAAADSVPFIAFVESWEETLPDEESPGELLEDGARVVELDGQVIVEERKASGEADFYSLVMIGRRPVVCFADDDGIEELAGRYGVSVEIDRDGDSHDPGLIPILADGEAEALYQFVIAVFREGNLACQVRSGSLNQHDPSSQTG